MVDWKKYEGYREVMAYPAIFAEDRFKIDKLWEAVKKAEILYRGWPFIYVDNNRKDTYVIKDSIETVVDISEIRRHDYFERWRLFRSGLFLHRTLMGEDTYGPWVKRGKILGFENTIYHVSEAIGSLWHLYSELGVTEDENITIKFIYKGVKDRNLVVVSPSRAGFMSEQLCKSEEISIENNLQLVEWRESEVDIASEICSEIFQQFQWIQSNMSVINDLSGKLLAKKMLT